MKKYHMYVHRRKTDGKIFYVGKGTDYRVRSSSSRNRHWHCIVEKHGFYPEIIQSFNTQKEAYQAEINKIKEIGLENLCNVTSGGEGGIGASPGKDHPMYGRIGRLHPRYGKRHSEEQRENIRIGRRLGKKNTFSKSGRDAAIERMTGNSLALGLKHTSETIERIKASLTGDKNPNYKKELVEFCHKDGEVFIGTRRQFLSLYDVSAGNISSVLTGKLKQTKGWTAKEIIR